MCWLHNYGDNPRTVCRSALPSPWFAAALKDDAENHRDFSAPVMDHIYIYRHQAASEIRITS